MSPTNQPRRYISFEPSSGYPGGCNLFYECTSCDTVIPSLPSESTECQCGNIAIDVEYGRIVIRDHLAMKLFSIDKV